MFDKIFTVIGIIVLVLLFFRVTRGALVRTVRLFHYRDMQKDDKPEPVKDKYFAIILPLVLFIVIFLLLLMVR